MTEEPRWPPEKQRLWTDAHAAGLMIKPASGGWLVQERETGKVIAGGSGVGLTYEELELVVRGTDEQRDLYLD